MEKDFFNVEGDTLRIWEGGLPKALSKEENEKLLWEYKNTQDKALKTKIRDKIIYGNMRLVLKYFRERVLCENKLKEDMLQEMIFCMIEAVDEFDFKKNASFSTFLRYKISRGICNLMTYSKAKCRSGKKIVSLYEPANIEDDDGLKYEDTLAGKSRDANDLANKIDLDFVLTKILPNFSETEQNIFRKHFLQKVEQRHIAEEMGVSHQYISNILKRMRVEMKEIYEKGKDANLTARYKNCMTYVASRNPRKTKQSMASCAGMQKAK